MIRGRAKPPGDARALTSQAQGGPLVIGITGGIGSGKGLASEFFESRGAAILDADAIARELAEPGSEMLAELATAFGPEVVAADGHLDRRRLAQLVFGRPETRERAGQVPPYSAVTRLNAITHPRILAEVRHRLDLIRKQGEVGVACVVAPLLLEAGARELVDRVLVMTAAEGERIARVRERDGLSEEQVRARMGAQMPVQEQTRQADWVVDTTGGREQAIQELERIWAEASAERARPRGRPYRRQ